MEDQRNWSDASYKTYVRPLARSWPYVVPGGNVDRQSVRLSIEGAATATPRADTAITITPGAPVGPMPRIGLVVYAAEADATLAPYDAPEAIDPPRLLLPLRAESGGGAGSDHGRVGKGWG